MKGTQRFAPLSLSIITVVIIVGLMSATDLAMVDALLPSCSNLTGVWSGNDNARYYIRQDGDAVYWFGISNDA